MEKITLNNQIVLMRKHVKQAKVHVINKLVKQVKLLRNRKGSEAQVLKAKRKADRFLEEIVLLKKIKPDHVSKLALSKTLNWEDVLKQKSSTQNDRCMAMLANYAAVQKDVEEFHSAHKELVLKIPDLIEQWNEKNKYSKNSSKGKKISVSIEKGSKKDRKKTNENALNGEKSETDNLLTANAFSSEEKLKKNMDECSNENNKEIKFSTNPSGISVLDICKHELDSTVDSAEITNHKESDLTSSKNISESKKYMEENILGAHDSDIVNKTSENKDILVNKADIQKSNFMKNVIRTEHSDRDEDLGENETEIADSDTDEESEQDSESLTSRIENQQKFRSSENKNNFSKPEEFSVSESIKKINDATNSSGKKLKAIALLNLDDLQDFDEIPVSNKGEKNQSEESEMESSEDEIIEATQNKRNDPFFLGCGEDDSAAETKLIGFSKNNNFSFDEEHPILPDSQRERNNFFERKRNFEKFSKTANFSRGIGAKFQKDRDNFKPFQTDKFTSRKYQSEFQPRDKKAFNRNNPRKQGDLKREYKPLQNYREKKHEDKTKYNRNNKEKFSVQHTKHPKKGNANDKPLHPSWEAKRKQKESSSFQGKRIVFDD